MPPPSRGSAEQRQKEYAYLEDVAITSIDLLIQRLDSNTRRLLWIITLANEAVDEKLLAGVWSGDSLENEQLRQIAELLVNIDRLPEELQNQLKALLTELRQANGFSAKPAMKDSAVT